MEADDNSTLESGNVKIPSWVIYFVVLLFAISVFGYVFFLKYPKSVHYYNKSIELFQENDLENAEKYIITASDLVPGNKEILAFRYYVSGIKKYTEKNSEEALELFQNYLKYNRDDPFINQLVATMKISQAFDDKDYNLMTELAADLYSDFGEDPLVILQYASALACKYADTDNIDDYNKAMELVETARTYELDDYNLDYIKRIEYRLSTKKIISKAEYMQLEEEGKL